MTSELHDRLRLIGFSNAVAQALAGLGPAGDAMRVVEVHRERVELSDGSDQFSARVRPSVVRDLGLQQEQMAVGDWVLASRERDGSVWVAARMAPLTRLARRTAGGRQCLVSNVDTALLVMGLDRDFNLRRLERYLALARSAGVWPVVILTKLDAAASADVQVEAARGRIPANVPIIALDAREPAAATDLAAYLAPGQTLVALGSSGAGKSTLTNTLLGRAEQATGAVRANDSRGRHTTTQRSLHRLAGGACIIDTPGLRGLQADIDEAGLNASYADIGALAEGCRFRDCQHASEPGCAVRAGVLPDRLTNFHKMQREIRRETMTVLERRQQLAEWKARSRGAEERMKIKRG